MNDDDRIALARSIAQLSAELIGSFPAACGGRHHYGHTCDYCLVDDLLRAARAVCTRLEGA